MPDKNNSTHNNPLNHQSHQILTSSPNSSFHNSSPTSSPSYPPPYVSIPRNRKSEPYTNLTSATQSFSPSDPNYSSMNPSLIPPSSPNSSYRTQSFLSQNHQNNFNNNRPQQITRNSSSSNWSFDLERERSDSDGSTRGGGHYRFSGSSNGSGGSNYSNPTLEQAQTRADHFRAVQDDAPRDPKDDCPNLMSNNIYVNGLDSNITDQDLLNLGSAYGKVLSYKAIICEHTSECKGFGFLLFSNRIEAQNAINGLVSRGLFASTAKESYRAKFRRLSDKGCSNVYVSNLPSGYSIQDLEIMCLPYTSMSSRIITDNSGISKGVGFMRFDSREIAQRVISLLHLKIVEHSDVPIQARFADSEAQKRLRGSGKSSDSTTQTDESQNLNSSSSSSPIRNSRQSEDDVFMKERESWFDGSEENRGFENSNFQQDLPLTLDRSLSSPSNFVSSRINQTQRNSQRNYSNPNLSPLNKSPTKQLFNENLTSSPSTSTSTNNSIDISNSPLFEHRSDFNHNNSEFYSPTTAQSGSGGNSSNRSFSPQRSPTNSSGMKQFRTLLHERIDEGIVNNVEFRTFERERGNNRIFNNDGFNSVGVGHPSSSSPSFSSPLRQQQQQHQAQPHLWSYSVLGSTGIENSNQKENENSNALGIEFNQNNNPILENNSYRASSSASYQNEKAQTSFFIQNQDQYQNQNQNQRYPIPESNFQSVSKNKKDDDDDVSSKNKDNISMRDLEMIDSLNSLDIGSKSSSNALGSKKNSSSFFQNRRKSSHTSNSNEFNSNPFNSNPSNSHDLNNNNNQNNNNVIKAITSLAKNKEESSQLYHPEPSFENSSTSNSSSNIPTNNKEKDITLSRQSSRSNNTERFGLDEKISLSSPIFNATAFIDEDDLFIESPLSFVSSSSPVFPSSSSFQFDPDEEVEKSLGVKKL